MFANKKLLTTMCPGDAYAHQATHTHSQPLFLRLCMILFLSLVGMGATWAETTLLTYSVNAETAVGSELTAGNGKIFFGNKYDVAASTIASSGYAYSLAKSSTSYVKITLAQSETLKAGDKIFIKGYVVSNPSDTYRFAICKTTASANDVLSDRVATVVNSAKNIEETLDYTIPAGSDLIGLNSIVIVRNGGAAYFTGIIINRTEGSDPTPVTGPEADFKYGLTSWTTPGTNDMTITVPAHKAGNQLTVTLSNITDGATAACTSGGTLSGNTLSITAPAAGNNATSVVTVTKDAVTTTYNIKVNTETKTGTTFDENTRYSKLLIEARKNDFYSNTNSGGLGYGSNLDYVPGLVAKAMIDAVDYYKDHQNAEITNELLASWYNSVKTYGSKPISTNGIDGKSFDDLNATKIFFGLKNVAASGKVTGIEAYSDANTKLASALSGIKKANTSYSISSSHANYPISIADMQGGWWHKADYINQMWGDGQYMGTALLAQLINDADVYNESTRLTSNDWDVVANQIKIYHKYAWDNTVNLPHHAFVADKGTNSDSHSDTWKMDGDTYHNEGIWGRAAGWYFMALVDVLEQMPSSHADYNTIKGYLSAVASGIKERQDDATGCWYQLPLYDHTFSAAQYNNSAAQPGRVYNYLESSATALYTAAYLKAIRLGLLDKGTYEATAKMAYQGIIENFMSDDNNLFWCCKSAGLGGKGDAYEENGAKFRDGSNAYYLKGNDVAPTKPGSYTEGKVLGAFIMAATEYERAYLDIDAPVVEDATIDGTNEVAAGETIIVDIPADATYYYAKWDGSDVLTIDQVAVEGNKRSVSSPTEHLTAPSTAGTYYLYLVAENGGVKSNLVKYTYAVTADEPGETTTKFSLTVKDDAETISSLASNSTQELAPTYAEVEGGSASVKNTNNSAQNVLNSDSNGKHLRFGSGSVYLIVDLNTPIAEGDVISFTSPGTAQLCFTTTESRNTSIATTSNSYTVPNGSSLIGAQKLYVWRESSTTTYVDKLTITSVAHDPYTVTFSNNDHSGNNLGQATENEAGAGVDLPGAPVPYAGYTFLGWSTNQSATEPDANLGASATKYYPQANGTLYAIYSNGNTIGNEETGFWRGFSKFVELPTNKAYKAAFHNNGGSGKTYKNWVLIATNNNNGHNGDGVQTDGTNEYFALRADGGGWGDMFGTSTMYKHNGANYVQYTVNENDEEFIEALQNAEVSLSASYANRRIYIYVNTTCNNGAKYVNVYESKQLAADATVYLSFTTENSSIDFSASDNTPNAYIVKPQVEPAEGSVDILSADGISFGPYGIAVPAGTQVTFNATANDGYNFANWENQSSEAESTDAQYAVAINADKTLTAKFSSTRTYSVVAKCGDVELKTVASGSATGSSTVYYPKYILNDGTLYEITANGSHPDYGVTVTPEGDNYVKELNYTATSIQNVTHIVEAEDINGFTGSNSDYVPQFASSGKVARSANNYKASITLIPGTYTITASGISRDGGTGSANFKVGDNIVHSLTIASSTTTTTTSEPFVVRDNTVLYVAAEGTDQRGLDYFYVVRTGDVAVEDIHFTGDLYAVESGKTYYAGQKIIGDHVTAQISSTLGESSVTTTSLTNYANSNFTQRLVVDNCANPTPAVGPAAPTAGTYYKFTPSANGYLRVALYLNSGRTLHVTDGTTELSNYTTRFMASASDEIVLDANNQLSTAASGTIIIPVTAGKDYYLWGEATKIPLQGFSYSAQNIDPTATFTIGGNAIEFEDEAYTKNIAASESYTTYDVEITPAIGGTVLSATNATLVSGTTYRITVPTGGNSISSVFTIQSESGETTKSYTIRTVKEASMTTLFNMVVSSDETVSVNKDGSPVNMSGYTSTLTGGTAELAVTVDKSYEVINKDDYIRFATASEYVKITLDQPLAAGDVIEFTSYRSDQRQLAFTTGATRDTKNLSSDGKFVVPADMAGVTELYVWRAESNTSYLQTLKISRPAVTFDATIKVNNVTLSPVSGDGATSETPEIYTYEVAGDYEGSAVPVSITTTGTVSETITSLPVPSYANTIVKNFTIEGENGAVKYYRITLTRAASSNNTITSAVINGSAVTVTGTTISSVIAYTGTTTNVPVSLTLPEGATAIGSSVGAITSEDEFTLTLAAEAESTVSETVTVTAQNGDQKVYTITLTRGKNDVLMVTYDGQEYMLVKENAYNIGGTSKYVSDSQTAAPYFQATNNFLASDKLITVEGQQWSLLSTDKSGKYETLLVNGALSFEVFVQANGGKRNYKVAVDYNNDGTFDYEKTVDFPISGLHSSGLLPATNTGAVLSNNVKIKIMGNSSTVFPYKVVFYSTQKARKDVILSYSAPEWDGEGDAPTLSAIDEDDQDVKSSITINYETDDPKVATVASDGTVSITPAANGNAIIYAKFEGNEDYNPATTQFVVKKQQGVSFSLPSDASARPVRSHVFLYSDNSSEMGDDADEHKDVLVTATFGGWNRNQGKYNPADVTDKTSTSYKADEWGAATKAINPVDGYIYATPVNRDAANESLDKESYYGKTRNGWFQPAEMNPDGTVAEAYPFTLPVRGGYMTFEPTVNGTLTIYIDQNGAWDNDGGGNADFMGHFRKHAFFITDQNGVSVSNYTDFATITKTPVTQADENDVKFTCDIDAYGNATNESIHNIANWDEFKNYFTRNERLAVKAAWNTGVNGAQKVIKLDNGSFLVTQRSSVKYTFYVSAGQTYYLFSNFSKMGFCGLNFVKDETPAHQPTATLTLSDKEAYQTSVANAGSALQGNISVPQYKEITLDRTFKADTWNTIYLPFVMTEKEVREVFGEDTELILLNRTFLDDQNNDKLNIEFIYHEIQDILAGYPYLIKPTKQVKAGDIVVYNKLLDPNAKEMVFTSGDYSAHGTMGYCSANVKYNDNPGYDNYSAKLNEGDIYVNGGNLYIVNNQPVYSRGYRSYIEYIGTDPQTASAKTISLYYLGGNNIDDDEDDKVATYINFAELNDNVLEDLGLKSVMTGVYNLNGQKIADDAKNLPAGLYIINGKKVSIVNK